MAIASAVQRGNWIYIYDEKGNQIRTFPASEKPNEGLKGYTSSSVSIQLGMWIYVFDENGRQITTIPV